MYALDVAGVAPLGSPAVLDEPVGLYGAVHVGLGAVAHDQDAMIQSGAAGSIEDSAGVQLELTLVRLDCNADGLVSHRLQATHDVPALAHDAPY